MKMVKRHILFLFLVVALLTVSTSVVFAKELGLLTISGPGIKGEVTLKDPEAMMDLERAGFFDQAHLTRSLRSLIGETPARVARRERQLSFLYKTDPRQPA